MHSGAEVAHLDLKLDNVLLTDEYQVKLCDLGFSQSIHNRVYRAVGTDGYKAPEIHKLTHLSNSGEDDELYGQGYSGRLADIFALGVILFTLHFGVPPFSEATKDDRLYKLLTFKSNSADKKAVMRFFLR